MRSVQHLLQFITGCYHEGFCLLLMTENIRQFRIAPVRDVVVLCILSQNGSLDRVSRVLVHENEGLKIVAHDRRKLLHGHLERSFSGKQDMTPSGRRENGSKERTRCITYRTPDKSS